MNRYWSSKSHQTDPTVAAAELLAGLPSETPPSLVVLFASNQFADGISEIVTKIVQTSGSNTLLGCTGEAIIADGQEIEDTPCISLWCAWWPEATVDIQRLTYAPNLGEFDGVTTFDSPSAAIVLADAFTFPADVLLADWNERFPNVPVVGGIASGGNRPDDTRLICGDQIVTNGAVVANICNAPMHCVVSQGCRPIGDPFVITKAERNEIFELGGKPTHDQLQQIYARLPTRDKDLMRQGIHLGRVVNEYQEAFEYGDFLMRNIMGFDQESGSITVGDFYRAGQTVQFHLRDAISASHDLTQLLQQQQKYLSENSQQIGGALLFTCNGRGSRLFEHADHDAQKLQTSIGQKPVGGFFCGGELGPVGGQNFLHGFTASIAMFTS